MKKIVLISIVAIIASITSYAQEGNSANKRFVNFHLITDENIQTRTNGTYRYILEVYEGTDVSGTRLHHIENNTGNFPVTLEQNKDYVCLFWADGGIVDNTNGTYDASDLRAVSLNASEEMEDAFFATSPVNITTATANNIKLKRAIAKVNLIEQGTVTANTNLLVTFNQYPSFNTFSSAVAGTATSITKTFNSSATTNLLGTFLTFASIGTVASDGTVTAGGTSFTFNFVFDGTSNSQSTTLVANYPTNLIGEYDE